MLKIYLLLGIILMIQTAKAEGKEARHERIHRTIASIATEHEVDPLLLAALCYKESRYKYFYNMTDGGSPSYGPCQIKDVAAKQVGLYRPYMTTEETIAVAAKYLKYKISKCGDIRAGIAAYNTGKCKYTQRKGGYTDAVMRYYELLKSGKSLYAR